MPSDSFGTGAILMVFSRTWPIDSAIGWDVSQRYGLKHLPMYPGHPHNMVGEFQDKVSPKSEALSPFMI